jgi:hypothetical protein
MIQISNLLANFFIFAISLGITVVSIFSLIVFCYILKDWYEEYYDR